MTRPALFIQGAPFAEIELGPNGALVRDANQLAIASLIACARVSEATGDHAPVGGIFADKWREASAGAMGVAGHVAAPHVIPIHTHVLGLTPASPIAVYARATTISNEVRRGGRFAHGCRASVTAALRGALARPTAFSTETGQRGVARCGVIAEFPFDGAVVVNGASFSKRFYGARHADDERSGGCEGSCRKKHWAKASTRGSARKRRSWEEIDAADPSDAAAGWSRRRTSNLKRKHCDATPR